MKRILFVLALAFFAASCAPVEKNKAPFWAGARDIQIDEKASLGLVKVVATGGASASAQASAPSDAMKIDMLVRALTESGRLTRLQVVPTENGKLYCFGFASDIVKSTAYELLRSIETDPSSTRFHIGSGESCKPKSE